MLDKPFEECVPTTEEHPHDLFGIKLQGLLFAVYYPVVKILLHTDGSELTGRLSLSRVSDRHTDYVFHHRGRFADLRGQHQYALRQYLETRHLSDLTSAWRRDHYRQVKIGMEQIPLPDGCLAARWLGSGFGGTIAYLWEDTAKRNRHESLAVEPYFGLPLYAAPRTLLTR